MKSKRIKKIGVLLVFSIFVSLISFNMAWAELKTFYFVLNDQDDWTYTLGDPATGSFTVDVSGGVCDTKPLEDFNIQSEFLFVEMMYTPHVFAHFINGVPSTSICDFKLSGEEMNGWTIRRLEMNQEVGGLKSGNHWALYMYDGESPEGGAMWEKIGQGNWFFIPNEYVEWSGAPRTPKIPRYDTPILINVNNMVDFTPIPGTYVTIPFTNDFLPSECGCPDTSVGLFSFQAVLENTSCTSLTDLTVKVHTLTNDNLLVLARGNSLPEDFVGGETGGEGALWTLPASGYYDGRILYQGPSKAAVPRFGICLKEIKRFDFYVDVLGKVQ